MQGWLTAFEAYRHRRVLGMVFLGFSAGLPFMLVFSTLTVWLSDFGVEKAAIGLFAWIGLTYSLKFIWAPVVDRVRLPLLGLLGQRRSWMLLAQVGIGVGLYAMAQLDPAAQTLTVAGFALLVAFSSATQDITIDAYRIEAVEEQRQGAMAAAYNLGYRLAVLAGSAGALIIADQYDWVTAYEAMAALALVGVITTLVIREPEHATDAATAQMEARLVRRASDAVAGFGPLERLTAWVTGAVISPFVEFFRRHGRFALVLLLLIATYSISDRVMGIMANVFYREIGFSKTEIGTIAKGFGFFMTMLGVGLGGLLVAKIGNLRTMLISVVLIALTNLMFALLVLSGPDIRMLAVTISADNLSQGISVVGFIAYLSSLTNKAYTATQYALFSSLMSFAGKLIAGGSGFVVEAIGWINFFVYAAAMGTPAIFLILYVMRHERRDAEPLAE